MPARSKSVRTVAGHRRSSRHRTRLHPSCSLTWTLSPTYRPSGVIGAGRIGRVHLETLAGVPGVQPVILSDVVEPVLKEVRA